MKQLAALMLLPMLLLGSEMADPAEFIDPGQVIQLAEYRAAKILGSSKCEQAFRAHFPGWSEEYDLVATWERVYIHYVEWIVKMPFARGATQCDISIDTFVLSTGYIGWGSVDVATEVMIHELVHLMRCPEILNDCGSQHNCPPSRIVAEERIAYRIGAMCTD